jgi:hypothetical protein
MSSAIEEKEVNDDSCGVVGFGRGRVEFGVWWIFLQYSTVSVVYIDI